MKNRKSIPAMEKANQKIVASILALVTFATFSKGDVIVGLQDWQFSSNKNPATPEMFENISGVSLADISIGYAGEGWIEDLSAFGGQTGLWDLGAQNQDDATHDTRGKVQFHVPNPGNGASGGQTELIIKVVQFIDKIFYTGDLTFSPPGGILTNNLVVERVDNGPLSGDWVEQTYQWQSVENVELLEIVMTGSSGGTLLDGVRILTSTQFTAVIRPITVSVTHLGEVVRVSWIGGKPPFQLYRTGSLPCPPEAWQPVGGPVSDSNEEITIDSSAGFIRVGGSI